MLSKLIKYEFKATARYFLPLYAVLICMTIINKIFISMDVFDNGYFSIIRTFFMATYVMLTIAIACSTFIIMTVRFYQNLITDEGYLMFTLPVKTSSLIISKWVMSAFWILASGICVLLSLFTVFMSPSLLSHLSSGWNDFYQELTEIMYPHNTIIVFIEIIIMCLISLFFGIMMVYTSIAIGQVVSRRKIIAAFLSYIALYTGMQFITTFIFIIISLTFGGFEDPNPSILITVLFPLSILISTITSTLFFLTTNYIFKNKLNLE